MADADPSTPEWSVAFTAKRVLRMFLGPRYNRRVPVFLADEIVKHMRLTNWLITKRPPDPPHSTPGE